MSTTLISLVTSSIFCSLVTSTPFSRRQVEPTSVKQFITQVKSAVYVVDSLKVGNETTSCADPDLEGQLNIAGYDGGYAQRLL